jgi:hypothetical protein
LPPDLPQRVLQLYSASRNGSTHPHPIPLRTQPSSRDRRSDRGAEALRKLKHISHGCTLMNTDKNKIYIVSLFSQSVSIRVSPRQKASLFIFSLRERGQSEAIRLYPRFRKSRVKSALEHHPHFENPHPRQKAQPSPNSSSPPQSGHSGQRPRWFLLPPFAQSEEA